MIVPADVPFTAHCRRRWDERFPGERLEAAFARARRVAFARLLAWSRLAGKRTYFRSADEYRHDPVTSALFVLSNPGGAAMVVTVFPFVKPGKKRKR